MRREDARQTGGTLMIALQRIRKPATKVVVFQWPYGTLIRRR
jgi:hypothetical protein